VNGQLIRQVAALGHFDGVDFTNQIRNRNVRSGKLLAVAPVATDPIDLHAVAVLRHEVKAASADGRVRVVVDLASGDRGNLFIEQADQRAHDPALGLTALAKKDDVVAGDDCVGKLRQDGLVVADDALE
jgi:hypothetical protein